MSETNFSDGIITVLLGRLSISCRYTQIIPQGMPSFIQNLMYLLMKKYEKEWSLEFIYLYYVRTLAFF